MFKTNRYGKKNRIGNLLSISTICIVLIAAFGLLGASFASWSQPFAIFGSITTGHINIIVRDVVLESSDGYESRSFTANKVGDIVDSVDMDVVTDVDPFHSVVVFTVENNGTIPVTCEGVDEIAGGDDVEVQL
ncbi:MAG: hypothetical protein K8F30_06460, partial [Taibaiella sp.]|nr:hypothetical protein [Taibaiella sp.]